MLRAIMLGSAALASVPAQSAEVQGGAKADASLDTVVVVGSRRTDQTRLTSAAPVDVISNEQLTRSGTTSLSQALQNLLPSFNFPQNNTTNRPAQSVRSFSLRGLSPDETLVLVNGKRRHKSARVAPSEMFGAGANVSDLDTIPISAIDHIEVLRDGASALYGSDAIAGVINIVLKEVDDGHGGISTQVGQFSKGDGLRKSINGYYGITLPNDGFVTLSLDTFDRQKAYNGIADTRQMYFAGDARESSFAQRKWFYGSGEADQYSLGLNSEYGFSDTLRGYTFATYAKGNTDIIGFLRPPRDNNTYRAYYPDGYQPGNSTDTEDLALTTGLRFDAGDSGQFDFSVGYGRNAYDESVHDSVNVSMGSDSPTSFYSGGRVGSEVSTNLEYKNSIDVAGLAKPLEVAAGIGYRNERIQTRAGDPASYINGGVPIADGPNAGNSAPSGAQGYGGLQPSDAGTFRRDNFSAYFGLENQVTDKLQLGSAIRFERYSDFGSKTTGKLSGRYDFTPEFALRGSVSTGFHAPSLAQQTYSSTSTVPINGVLYQSAVLPVSSPVAQALGATDLKPEKSLNLTLGFVYRPASNVSVTLDAYQIDIDDRLVFTDRLSGTYVTAALQRAGVTNYSNVAFFTNGLDTRTRGADLVFDYSTQLARHPLKLSAAASVSNTVITGVRDLPSQLQGSGLNLLGNVARTVVTDASPKNKLRFGALYSVDDFDIDLAFIRYGEYRDASPGYRQELAAQWVTNLNIGYHVNDKLKLRVGADNLFNTHPEKLDVAGRAPVVYEYSAFAPDGAFGTFLYAGLDYNF
ncbi:TonB-dependent receptor plug domain-containing protein [Pseudomonas sp. LRF_L74]|uniref:TonB-dependent receptor plug domain-containing protein n=1 Tax=Pseudomonas sp. LRF_L74 TaxID=3369422 RepID=UPI003F5DE2F5